MSIPKEMPKEVDDSAKAIGVSTLSDENADRITELIQFAGIHGCPMCLGGIVCMAAGPPLTEDQRGRTVKHPKPIQCTRNKYHLCSVDIFNGHDYLLVSIMDVLERPA